MSESEGDVRAELEQMLDLDDSRLGEVFRLTREGLDPPAIATRLGVSTSGFVANYRAVTAAILDGRIPRGVTMRQQIAAQITTRLRRSAFSEPTRDHLLGVVEQLGSDLPTTPGRPTGLVRGRSLARSSTLRRQTDDAIRERVTGLIERVKHESEIDADDYQRIVASESALDRLIALVGAAVPSRTTSSLIKSARPEYTLEHALLDWAADLPIPADTIDIARGRLAYWSS